MPPLRRVSSCSPSARARTVTAHSLNAIGMWMGVRPRTAGPVAPESASRTGWSCYRMTAESAKCAWKSGVFWANSARLECTFVNTRTVRVHPVGVGVVASADDLGQLGAHEAQPHAVVGG